MHKIWVGTLLCSLLSACDEHKTADTQEASALTIALKGSDSRGQPYRLRNAEFEIWGCADQGLMGASGFGGSTADCLSTTVSSEDNVDAEFITRRLLPGSYNVTLRGDWFLEETSGNQPERVGAVLLSPSTQSAYVWDGGSQTVYYSFGVGGDVIDFRHGDLNIGIQVEQPGDHNNTCTGGPGSAGSYPCPQGGRSGLPVAGVAGTGVTGAAGASSP